MQFMVGSYTFATGVPDIASRVSTEWSETGQPLKQTFTFAVKGVFKATSQSDCKVKELALRQALRAANRDLVLLMDDSAESAVLLKAQGSTTGIKITAGPDFPTTFGPQCLEYRTFEFTAEATYPYGVEPDGSGVAQEQAGTAVSWQESLSLSGGFPRVIFHEDINGAEPLKEIVVPRTTYKAVQSGSAVGFLTYPPFPPFIFPQDVTGEPSQVREGAPDGMTGWKISWSYQYESARPLVGLPHFWRSGGVKNGS